MKQPIIFMILILVLVGPGPVFSRDEQERLDVSSFEMPQRPGAVFDHDDHNENAGILDDCAFCHHVYDNKKLVSDESSEDNSCADCHGLKPVQENGISLMRAFHKRCRDCHFNSGKGPVLCGQCHIKK